MNLPNASESFKRANPHLYPQEQPTAAVSRESDLHDEIEKYCRERGWYYVHSRMDRPTTTALGVPDFIVALPNGKVVWVECKGAKTKTTDRQIATGDRLRRLGHVYAIVRSMREFEEVVG